MTCPSCGSDVPAGARFCPTCGHQVDLRGDERRVVTVLFADLARFTGLSESLDPESVKLLVDRCFAALAQDVTSHGGLVDKVVGDAIVALFGAPVAHEDDAERAVRSGLQMQRTIASLAVELDTPLQLRIGINTGEVLVGALRAGGDYTAMGDVVNVASRLQTAAQPGMVVVGAATRSATVDTVVYRELGQLVPRGREESVEVWEAVECLAPPGRRPRRAIAPLIGRESELELLRRSVAGSVTRRRPNLIVVVGDAGVGKSRLTLELSNWAAGSLDALVLEGRALPYGEANPWWPMAEVVQQACGITGSDTAEVARSHVAETVAGLLSARPGDPNVILVTAGLLHLMGHQDALRDVDPQRARQQARNALRTLILGLARRRPLILLLSEMHWADDLVLDLVGDGLDRFTGLPVTIALTARPELLERWSVPTGRYNVAVLHLDPLDDDASRRLVEALIEGAAPPGLVETLAARSGGNPFFVEELVSLTAHETEGGRGVELPATLRGIVGARFDSLSAEERSVLEDAAVIGRSGFVYTLRSMARTHGTADPDRVISQLVAQDLVAVTDGRWQFRSEVVREVVYDIITKTERARRHWELAEWIAAEVRRMRREDEFLEPLAHHYATAAELVAEIGPVTGVPATATAEAVAALTRAAHWSSDRELLLPAARLFDRALALLSDAGVNARRALLLDRALVRTTLRQLPGARADLDEAAEGAEGADRARALTVQGYVEQTESDWDRSMATLTRAVEEWRLIGDRDGEGDALRRAGMTSLFAGNVARAQELLDSALELARVDGHRRDEAWTLWHLAWASFASGATAEAESRLADAEEAFRSAGDTGGLGWVSGLLGWLRMVQGRRSEAEQLATGVLEDARERGDRWAVGMLLVLLGLLRLWDGRVSAALEMAKEGRVIFSELNDGAGLLRALGLLARAHAAAGQLGEARKVAAEAESMRNAGHDSLLEPLAATLVGVGVALHAGDGEAALTVSENEHLSTYGDDAELSMLAGLALLQVGRTREGLERLEVAGLTAVDGSAPNVMATLALGRAAAGDRGGAEAAAERALTCDPPGTYRDLVLAELARLLVAAAAGRGDDVEERLGAARALLEDREDRLTPAVVALAAARAHQALGTAGAEAELGTAHAALVEMGTDGAGWDQIFTAALNR